MRGVCVCGVCSVCVCVCRRLTRTSESIKLEATSSGSRLNSSPHSRRSHHSSETSPRKSSRSFPATRQSFASCSSPQVCTPKVRYVRVKEPGSTTKRDLSLTHASPAGMRSGRVFLRQPVIEVVDVGKNRVLEGAPSVTAICHPRPTCEIGRPIVFEETQVLVRTDAVIRKPQAGLVRYEGDERLGIVSSIKGASLRYTAQGALGTDMPISVGRTPYWYALCFSPPCRRRERASVCAHACKVRQPSACAHLLTRRTCTRVKITEGAPAIAQAGEPFRLSVQMVAKLDQPFGMLA